MNRQQALILAQEQGYKDVTAQTNKQFEHFQYHTVLQKGKSAYPFRDLVSLVRFIEIDKDKRRG